MTPGATELLRRLWAGEILRVGTLYLTGEWTVDDVNWLVRHRLVRIEGDRLVRVTP